MYIYIYWLPIVLISTSWWMRAIPSRSVINSFPLTWLFSYTYTLPSISHFSRDRVGRRETIEFSLSFSPSPSLSLSLPYSLSFFSCLPFFFKREDTIEVDFPIISLPPFLLFITTFSASSSSLPLSNSIFFDHFHYLWLKQFFYPYFLFV